MGSHYFARILNIRIRFTPYFANASVKKMYFWMGKKTTLGPDSRTRLASHTDSHHQHQLPRCSSSSHTSPVRVELTSCCCNVRYYDMVCAGEGTRMLDRQQVNVG